MQEIGEFGPIYYQYKDDPVRAIRHLMRVKKGECVAALHRDDIGYIDIVWGKNDPKTNKGFGLKHIIEKHEKDIEKLGFKIEHFIPVIVKCGNLNLIKTTSKKLVFDSDWFRFVIQTTWDGKEKKLLLTAFDIKKKCINRRKS